MNDSVFETVEKSSQILKLDFSSAEFARLAEEQELSEAQIEAVGTVLEYLQRKKIDTTIHTLLKMSRLPLKDPKTFDNFDFSVIKGRDAAKLKTLPSLSAIYAHRNLAFIGPAVEPVRPIWPRLLAMSAVRGELKPISLRCQSCEISSPPPDAQARKHPSHWRTNFNEDDALLCALDRIFDDATVFNIKGESFRGKKLETVALQTSRIKAPTLLLSNDVPTTILSPALI